jgi:REP element-mobilizing transposase RayT
MRVARKKMLGRSCYYHLCARITGAKDDYLFGDVDKEKGMKIVTDLSRLFFIEPISMCWMGNHWHLVVYSSVERPSNKEVAERYNSYYEDNHLKLDPDNNPEKCTQMGEQLCDISFFMRQIHQKFTYYINRTHNRRGTLWAERFKSTILEGRDALWSCVKYIELNPLRAGLVSEPANYRFSTWGNYCGSGKHIFENNFINHMRKSLGEIANDWSSEDVYAEFRGELARTIAAESEEVVDLHEIKNMAKCKESMPVRFLRRTRHWSDGAIIGSKAFVRDVSFQFYEKEKVLKKKFSQGQGIDKTVFHCFKTLRKGVY